MMREASDDVVVSWFDLGRSFSFHQSYGEAILSRWSTDGGENRERGCAGARARTSGTRPKTGRGERGERVGRSELPSGVTLCIGVHQESSALRSCVRAVIRRKNGETGGGKARERAPHGRPSPRASPRSTGVVRWSRRAHRPQTEKFTVCAHRARGCWVGDDPPSDASLALCARLMSSRGGVGGVDGDDRARRSTRRGHWRQHPRCQRRAFAASRECHDVCQHSRTRSKTQNTDCLPIRDQYFFSISAARAHETFAKLRRLVRRSGAPHATRARSGPRRSRRSWVAAPVRRQ